MTELQWNNFTLFFMMILVFNACSLFFFPESWIDDSNPGQLVPHYQHYFDLQLQFKCCSYGLQAVAIFA